MAESSAPRVAIKFGPSSSSNGLKIPSRAKVPSALGKRQRPQLDNDSDSEGEAADTGRDESVTHFGANGAEFIVEERSPRKDERSDKWNANGRRKGRSPAETGRRKGNSSRDDDETADDEKPMKYGLNLSKGSQKEKTNGYRPKDEKTAGEDASKGLDEEAMDALLGKPDPSRQHRTEDDAYRESKAHTAPADDLETYENYPVEGFGAALLRGQGWDGKMRGPKIRQVVRRANGLGLGAKKLNSEEDLGGWDSKGNKSDKRPRLADYRRDSDRERRRREDRHRDSYKNERDREKERERDHYLDRDDRGSHRHHERDFRR